ncbi:MAG TPA: tetratricopeptide repeat protein [Candidatus Kapabacteria bacterium]|nr:tetratricopeptide repeat protein [Candidatus Kapabacteria bacterium]
MMRIGLYVLVCGMLTLVSCMKKDENEMFHAADGAAQHGMWTEAMDGYNDVLKNFPNGKHAAEAMFKIGIIQTNQLKDYASGMKTLEDVATHYASSEEAPKALMTLGFLYANQPAVKNIDLAKKCYQQVVSQYPSSDLAASANMELETLGQSPAEALQRARDEQMNIPGHDSLVRTPSAQALAH